MHVLSEDAGHDATRQDWNRNGTYHIMIDDDNRKLVERSHSYLAMYCIKLSENSRLYSTNGARPTMKLYPFNGPTLPKRLQQISIRDRGIRATSFPSTSPRTSFAGSCRHGHRGYPALHRSTLLASGICWEGLLRRLSCVSECLCAEMVRHTPFFAHTSVLLWRT